MAEAIAYVETSVISFFHEIRSQPEMVARRSWTRDPTGDALHLALASFYRCDFLVTWNCKHLANANKFGHIRRVNNDLGLFVPLLVTPMELMEGDSSE